VYSAGKPKFQVRQGEEGLSAFDAEKVEPVDILPNFRPGSLLATLPVSTIEAFGLTVVQTPGDPNLPQVLRENHVEIRPGEGMTRKQFKAALRGLEQATGSTP
jgi:hypothetical protein